MKRRRNKKKLKLMGSVAGSQISHQDENSSTFGVHMTPVPFIVIPNELSCCKQKEAFSFFEEQSLHEMPHFTFENKKVLDFLGHDNAETSKDEVKTGLDKDSKRDIEKEVANVFLQEINEEIEREMEEEHNDSMILEEEEKLEMGRRLEEAFQEEFESEKEEEEETKKEEEVMLKQEEKVNLSFLEAEAEKIEEDTNGLEQEQEVISKLNNMHFQPISSGFKKFNNALSRCTDTEKVKKKKRGRTKILYSICEILTNIFNGIAVDFEGLALQPYEQQLIKYIVRIKSKNKIKDLIIEKLDLTCNSANEDLRKLLQNRESSDKRKDEMLKLVFKQTVKLLRNMYKSERSEMKPITTELGFLSHYFLEDSLNHNLPLVCYADPLKKGPMRNDTHKGLTINYITQIFRCTRFREDFLHTVNNSLKRDYQDKIFGKFRKLFKKLRLTLKASPIDQEPNIIARYANGIGTGNMKSIKFPWTDFEIQFAIRKFETHIKKLIEA